MLIIDEKRVGVNGENLISESNDIKTIYLIEKELSSFI